MLATLVMTVIGPDRPGLVELLAASVAQNGGNWLESRMCRLGGQFAGIVRAEISTENADKLVPALRSLETKGLRILTQTESGAGAKPAGSLALLELVGQDRPGILHQISRVLAAHSVNVEELSSERVSAPMDGNRLFQARATVLLPPSLSLASLRADLERIATDLMVDVELNPSSR
ncbi:glycine cleavage system protein R [Opitutaceae bacterium EW11]|nr:glycine cleavage system protein R [Opitutaceae bacterium EW11]